MYQSFVQSKILFSKSNDFQNLWFKAKQFSGSKFK